MELDEMVARAAEGQHGIFTLDQARASGATAATVKHRLMTGAWKAFPYARVYRLRGCPSSWEQELHALVLAVGPMAAGSHRSAAALLGIPGFARRGTLEVITTRPQRERIAGAWVHSSRALPPEHLTVVEGIVTTGVARTLVDLAGAVHAQRAERALDNCLARALVTLDDVRAATGLLARRGRPGIALMRRLLADRVDNHVPTESSLEARVVDLIRLLGLPDPVRQLDVGGDDGWIGRVDFAYPDRRLVIEVDSALHHTSLVDQRSDHVRDRRLRAAGWRIERITEVELSRTGALGDRLKALLDDAAA